MKLFEEKVVISEGEHKVTILIIFNEQNETFKKRKSNHFNNL